MADILTAYRQSYTFRDRKANTAKMSIWLPTQLNDLSATLSAAQLAAEGVVYGLDLYALQGGDTQFELDGATPTLKAIGPYTTPEQPWQNVFNSAGDYLNVEDKGLFVFQDAAGFLHRFQVPIINASNFLADGETIDQTNGAVKHFVADMLKATFGGTAPSASIVATAVSQAGVQLVKFIGGYRIRRRLHRKTNIFTRNPSLSGPGEG
jgi:hypothetical protein